MKRGDYEITKRGDEKIRTDPRMWEPRNKKCYERFPPKRADSFGPVGRLRARGKVLDRSVGLVAPVVG
jgi:hypothetical protein